MHRVMLLLVEEVHVFHGVKHSGVPQGGVVGFMVGNMLRMTRKLAGVPGEQAWWAWVLVACTLLPYLAWGTWRDNLALDQSAAVNEALLQALGVRSAIDQDRGVGREAACPALVQVQGPMVWCASGQVHIRVPGNAAWPALTLVQAKVRGSDGRWQWSCRSIGPLTPAVPVPCRP